MNRFRRLVLSLVGAVAFSTAAWFVVGRFSAETFLPLGMKFAGVGEDLARPIVERLYVALRAGLVMAPWLCLSAWFGIRAVMHNKSRLDRFPIFMALLVTLSLMSLPYPVIPAVPGLDNSWQWLLNQLAFANALGRDTVFTYGPLGFLICPQAPLVNVLAALAANLFHGALWAFALALLYRASQTAHAAAWLMLATMFFPQGNMEWRWVSLAVLLAAIPCVSPNVRWRPLLLTGAGLVLAIVTFMKFSSLVIVASAQVFCMGLIVVRERRFWTSAAPWAVAFAVGTAALAVGCFDSAASLCHWFTGSVAIASGYNKYMVVPKSWLELSVPFLALAVTATLLFLRSQNGKKAALVGLAFSPVFFCAAKYALVRQGPSPLFYLLTVFCGLVLCIQPQSRRRMVMLCAALFLVTYACTLPRAVAGDSFCHFAFGVNPMGLARTLTLSRTLRVAAEESSARVAPCRLPGNWRQQIGQEKVMFLPHEYAPAMSGDRYAWVVLPAFQLYSAYLPSLDAACAARLRGESAPQWIVCDVDPLWSGNFVGYPATWNAVFDHYECVAEECAPARLLLHRKSQFRETKGQTCNLTKKAIKAGEWVDCKAWANVPIAIDWPQTAMGKFCTLFLRNTLTYLSLRDAGGSEVTVPLLPENLSNPFPLSKIAVTPKEFVKVLKGGDARRPVAVRVWAESPSLYASELRFL